jgi:phage gpG-like protein
VAGIVRISVRDTEVQRGLDAMRGRGHLLGVVFRELRPVLRLDLREHAKFHAGPDGNWPPRAASTLAKIEKRAAKVGRTRTRKTKDGTRIRTRNVTRMQNALGSLPGSVRTKAGQRQLVAESPVAWAGIHNEGGIAGHGSSIPARPFVFFSENFLGAAEREIGRFVFFGWEKR